MRLEEKSKNEKEETEIRQEEFRSRKSGDGSGLVIDQVVIPKGWEREYEMANAARRGGSPRAVETLRREEEERRCAREEMFEAIFEASMRRSFDAGRRRDEENRELFIHWRNSSDDWRRATREDHRRFYLDRRRAIPDCVNELRELDLVIEELYISEVIYRSMLENNPSSVEEEEEEQEEQEKELALQTNNK